MINYNEKNSNTINFNVSIEECFTELSPHPKFKDCTFDSYHDDKNYPSQAALKELLRSISNTAKKPQKKSFFFRKNEPNKIAKNIYIDGTYGIGKTHLLSSCFHSYKGTKAFMSFLELTYFMNYSGLEKTIEFFKPIDLLLIDEFDLDDPATTRMAARFIESINNNTTIITTSNRLPKELGGGKFDTEQFARELGIISNTFDTITVEGKSFRINLASWQAVYSNKSFQEVLNTYDAKRGKLVIDFDDLILQLCNNHPFKFFVIPKNYDAVFINNFKPFTKLNDALRFTSFIDHCYYHDTKIFFNNKIDESIFPKEIMETTFERQFLRCNSRLDELGIFFKE